MEIRSDALLSTLAGLMVTFAGFSALLFGVRQAAGATLSVLDRFIAKNVMSYIFVLTAGALLPLLLEQYGFGPRLIWRWSAALFALPMLALQLTYPRRRRAVTGSGRRCQFSWSLFCLARW